MKISSQKYWKLATMSLAAMTLVSTSLIAQRLNMAVTSSGEILSGGPSSEAAQTALAERINQQSEGKILLLSFQPTKTKMATVD